MGELELQVIQDGTFALDGGAMFGVVPRPVWSRLAPPDEQNRIPLSLNCLLIRAGACTLLVEAGLGHDHTPEYRERFGCVEIGGLEARLAAHGVRPQDVDRVLLTHLHVDHAGGVSRRRPDGTWEAAFPAAEIWIQRGEWEAARQANEREQAAYMPERLLPLVSEGRVRFMDGDAEVAAGVRVEVLGGHTRHMMGVWIEIGSGTAFFGSDLVPTAAHLRYPYIMAFDLDPTRTLQQKKRLLRRAASEGWWWIFSHDARPMVRLAEDDESRIRVREEAV